MWDTNGLPRSIPAYTRRGVDYSDASPHPKAPTCVQVLTAGNPRRQERPRPLSPTAPPPPRSGLQTPPRPPPALSCPQSSTSRPVAYSPREKTNPFPSHPPSAPASRPRQGQSRVPVRAPRSRLAAGRQGRGGSPPGPVSGDAESRASTLFARDDESSPKLSINADAPTTAPAEMWVLSLRNRGRGRTREESYMLIFEIASNRTRGPQRGCRRGLQIGENDVI
jgi:hypothetical protein